MAESKKDRLKNIRRQFAQLSTALATAPCDSAILDFHKQLHLDIRETVQKLQNDDSSELLHVELPVMFQHLDHLQIRVTALQRRVDPKPF